MGKCKLWYILGAETRKKLKFGEVSLQEARDRNFFVRFNNEFFLRGATERNTR